MCVIFILVGCSAESLIAFRYRSEEEAQAGGAGDRRRTPGKAALHGRLLQSQRGALPQHPLCPRPQGGAPVQPLQTPEDCPGRTQGSGGGNRCPNPSHRAIINSGCGLNDSDQQILSYLFPLILVCFLILAGFPIPDNRGVAKEGCKKHELYVSFRDLGWQVYYHYFDLICHNNFTSLHVPK